MHSGRNKLLELQKRCKAWFCCEEAMDQESLKPAADQSQNITTRPPEPDSNRSTPQMRGCMLDPSRSHQSPATINKHRQNQQIAVQNIPMWKHNFINVRPKKNKRLLSHNFLLHALSLHALAKFHPQTCAKIITAVISMVPKHRSY